MIIMGELVKVKEKMCLSSQCPWSTFSGVQSVSVTSIVKWASKIVQPPRGILQENVNIVPTHNLLQTKRYCKQHNLVFTLQLLELLETFC